MNIYEVTKDIENPKPDRRWKRDISSRPIVKAGTLVIVKNFRIEPLPGQGLDGELSQYCNNDLCMLVYCNLKKVQEPTCKDVLMYYNMKNVTAEEIVLSLFRMGKISIADISEAAESENEETTTVFHKS